MPERLRVFLQSVPSNGLEKELWDYLDGNPNAVSEMIEVLCNSHRHLLEETK